MDRREFMSAETPFALMAASSEGGAHCQVGAGRMAFARIYEWLDQTFGLGGRSWWLERVLGVEP